MKTNYIPIVKWKKGERLALLNLKDEVKKSMIPLIELTEMVDSNILIEELKEYFPHEIFLDTAIASEDDVDYLKKIVSDGQANKMSIYPVLYYSNIDFYDFSSLTNNLCIKIGIPESIDGPSYTDIFDSIENLYGRNKDLKINLLLDLGIVTNSSDANKQYRDLKNIVNDYLEGAQFLNSIIICVTSFPEDVSKISAGEKVSFQRFDFQIYKKLLNDFKDLSDKFIYSDYGVTKFTDSDIDFRLIGNSILPKLKYTTEKTYLFWKGKKNRITKDWEISYYNLASELINSDFYSGKDFSFGDLDMYTRYEKAKAAKTNKCGSSTNWVTILANHHITLVSEQLSKLI